MKKTLHAHSMVANLAKEMALTGYENVMSDNAIRAEWKRRHPGASELGLQAAYVKRYWRSHVAVARATLAAMLARADNSDLHASIHEALVLDNTLVRGRNGAGAHG